MSVIKIRKPSEPFEVIDKASVNAIRDPVALAVWVFLRCKPEGWIVRETHVREQFGIGRDKYRASIRYLGGLGAIEDRRIQGEHGRIIGRELVVHYAVSVTDGFSADREPENPAHGASDSAASDREPENPSDGAHRAPEKPVRRRKPSDGKSAPLENKDLLENTDLVKNKATTYSRDVHDVFTYWQSVMGHPLAQLGDDRKRAILARLKDGYSVETLKRAIDGCKASEWHQGKNETGCVYDDIELICRKSSKVDHFLSIASKRAAARVELDAWLNEDRVIEGECRRV